MDTHQFKGVQKPISDIKEVVKKEQSVSDLVSALSSKVRTSCKQYWDVGSFEASGEITPKSLKSLEHKLDRIKSEIQKDLALDEVEKKNSDNYQHVVELTSYCLEILKCYGK